MSRHPTERADSYERIRGRARVGEWELTVLSDGFFYLDGGAMFGVVPKTLWEKRAPADEQNRILLGTNTVVAQNGKRTIVIETGLGNKHNEKLSAVYGLKKWLPESFREAGIPLESVDVVLNSHLHFDHCGWNTTVTPDGCVLPTFPNARYFAHAGDVEQGRLQRERDGMSYLSVNYEPLIERGQMTLLNTVAGEVQEIESGFSVELFPGHTAQMMGIHIESGGEHACYISDLIPTSAHLDVNWVMGYDLDPLRCIEERKRFLKRAIPEKWLVLFTHDHHNPFGRVELNERDRPVLVKSD